MAVLEGAAILPRQYLMRTYILHIPGCTSVCRCSSASVSMIATSVYYALAVQRAARRDPGNALPVVEGRLLVRQPVGDP